MTFLCPVFELCFQLYNFHLDFGKIFWQYCMQTKTLPKTTKIRKLFPHARALMNRNIYPCKLHKKSTSGFFKVFWVEGSGSRLSRPWLEKSWRVEGYQGLDLKKVEEFKAFKALTWKKLKANFKALSWSNPRFKAIVPRNLNFKVKIANSNL